MITDAQGCLLRIRGIHDSLKSAERRLADYILANSSRVVSLTMEELEAESSSSYATIYRFCKKLGFSGFRELKSALVQDVLGARSSPSTYEEVTIHDQMPIAEIVDKVFGFSSQVLNDTRSMVDVEVIQEAVSLLTGGGEVLFVGAGTSGISAQYAFTKFFRLGVDCHVEMDPVLCKMKAGILGEGDVAFAISSSGRTSHTISTAEHAKRQGATIIALTDYAVSPLSKIADVNLYTTPRNVNNHLELEMPLLIGQITIVDLLQMCCLSRVVDEATRRYAKTKVAADSEKR